MCIKGCGLFPPGTLNLLMKKIHTDCNEPKQAIFQEAIENLETNNKDKLDILEIGIGTGENFLNYPQNANLTVLDKTTRYADYLIETLAKNKREDLNLSKLVVCDAQNMKPIKSNSKDLVVHTFLLCSVKDQEKMMKEIYRVLRPGGMVIFVEHCKDSKNVVRRTAQRVAEQFTGDCCYQNIEQIIREARVYDKLVTKQYQMKFSFLDFMNPILCGYGQKKKEKTE